LARFNKENQPEPPILETGTATQTEPTVLITTGTQTDISMYTNPSMKEHLERITVLNQNLAKRILVEKERVEGLTKQLNKMKSLQTELENQLENIKSRSISFNILSNDEKKAKFYTGLPLATLNTLIDFLMEQDGQRSGTLPNDTTKKDEICLVLAKLRLNLLHQDIAFRGGVSLGWFSKRFHHWLDLMYHSLGGLIMWPPEDLPMQLPPVFKNRFLKKVKIVLDCFEIMIERPSSLRARAQTYSHYKSRNTAKVLLGASPSGAVTLVSKVWGGRASDKLITNNSGVLDKLRRGDAILADRGFLIREECIARGINLVMPSFTRGKAQLSRREVEMSRLISRARIHIERVINKCRDYRILKGPVPISLLKRRRSQTGPSTIDKIVHVCCCLTNMRRPVLSS